MVQLSSPNMDVKKKQVGPSNKINFDDSKIDDEMLNAVNQFYSQKEKTDIANDQTIDP